MLKKKITVNKNDQKSYKVSSIIEVPKNSHALPAPYKAI